MTKTESEFYKGSIDQWFGVLSSEGKVLVICRG